MNEIKQKAEKFLNEFFRRLGFELQARASASAEDCLLEIVGKDEHLLRGEGGELLYAIEDLLNQIFLSSLPRGARIVCDSHGFRAEREVELRAMAQHAAMRVRSTGVPFVFGPMSANERRIIHLALANNEDLVTESVGEGQQRRLKVSLKDSAK